MNHERDAMTIDNSFVMFTESTSRGQNMLIRVRVTPNAKQVHVVKVGVASFEVKVDEKAMGGRANRRLVEILSDYFSVPKSRIVLVSGAKSRDKVLGLVS